MTKTMNGPMSISRSSSEPAGMHQRLVARVHGRVQGVNFRYQTAMRARALVLTGTVCNRLDRTVEVVAEGPRPQLEQLLAWLWEGPSMAHVQDVQASWLSANGEFSSFEVR